MEYFINQIPHRVVKKHICNGRSNFLLKGLQKTNNTVLARIGPWDNGPAQNVSPFVFSNKLNYDVLSEITDFFDLNLKENTKKAAPKKTLWYYTIGEKK